MLPPPPITIAERRAIKFADGHDLAFSKNFFNAWVNNTSINDKNNNKVNNNYVVIIILLKIKL